MIPYQNRITLLRLSIPFITDLFPLPYGNMVRLQTLILQNIESNRLTNILGELSPLPCLYSLVIIPMDSVSNSNSLYERIFRLPVLKYCNVTLIEGGRSEPLPFAMNTKASSIETCLINHPCCVDQLNALLSYLPQIRRLSCHISSRRNDHQIRIQLIELKYLTHLSLTMADLSFDRIELLIRNLFSRLQVFKIVTSDSLSYSDTNQWERLISFYLANLRVFQVKLLSNQPRYLLWFNRQWRCEALESCSPTFLSIQSLR